MIFKVVSLFLFLSITLRASISEHINHGSSILHQNSTINRNEFVLVNPKQVPRLERTLRFFFSKMAEPINKPIVLKSTPNANDLQSTIRRICNCIRKRLMQFADDFGLINTLRRFEEDSSNEEESLTEDWYSEMLLQSIYLVRDLGNIINEIRSSIEVHFGGGNSTVQKSKQLARDANGFEFLGVVQDAAEFSDRLAQCLLHLANTKRSTFNLGRSFLNLINHPPKATLKTLKSTVNVTYSKTLQNRARQKPWHIFLCLSLVKNEEVNYDDCINELQHLDECLHSRDQRSNIEMYNVDMKSWTKAIRRLSDCKILTDKNGNVEVSCKSAKDMPRRIKKKTKYVFERMLDKRISTKSPFHRAVNDLGDTLSQSEWGQRFIEELYQYISIYEDGQKKLIKSSKFGTDKKAAARHKEISKALKEYKRGVLLRTFRAMNKMHRSAVDYEKFFAQGMKDTLNEAWQSHVKILTRLMDWMTKLLQLHVNEDSSGKEPISSDISSSLVEWNDDEDSNSENMEKFAMAHSRSKIAKDVDNSMNSLMKSMNRLSRHRSTNNKSTLACIANNLLLVTIFMETVGFVSSLYCFGQQTANEQNSLEFENDWNRARRSLLTVDHNSIIDLVSQDNLVLQLHENLTLPFLDENDWRDGKM